MAASRWRLEHLQEKAEEREKTGKAVLLYQGVSSIAPEAADDGQPSLSSALPRASSSSQEVATRFLSSILLADDYVMTVLLEGGESERCVVHACHIASKDIYHRCSLTPHLDTSLLSAARCDLAPLRSAVKSILARLRFKGGEVVVGAGAVVSEECITDIGAASRQKWQHHEHDAKRSGGRSGVVRESTAGTALRNAAAEFNQALDSRRNEATDGGEVGAGAVVPPSNAAVSDGGAERLLLHVRNRERVAADVMTSQEITVRVVTWNMQAKPARSVAALRQELLPMNTYHIYVVGTEECEHSIAQSVINTSKEKWEGVLREVRACMRAFVPAKSVATSNRST
jgi:hypothetical protein